MEIIKAFFIGGILISGLTGCQSNQETVETIVWNDGDSGTVNGVKFRLFGVDAPETGAIGSRNGAKCKEEQQLGFKAKAYIKRLTNSHNITITGRHGDGKHGRIALSLSANGEDIAKLGTKAGHYKPWPHANGKALTKRPDWCE